MAAIWWKNERARDGFFMAAPIIPNVIGRVGNGRYSNPAPTAMACSFKSTKRRLNAPNAANERPLSSRLNRQPNSLNGQ
jgi:hypothetical protein